MQCKILRHISLISFYIMSRKTFIKKKSILKSFLSNMIVSNLLNEKNRNYLEISEAVIVQVL